MIRIELRVAEISTLLKKEFDSLSTVEREPYDVMKKEAKERLQTFYQENPDLAPKWKVNYKRVAERLYCNSNLPELKKQRVGVPEKELREELRKRWSQLEQEEQEIWKRQAMEETEKKNEKTEKNGEVSEEGTR